LGVVRGGSRGAPPLPPYDPPALRAASLRSVESVAKTRDGNGRSLQRRCAATRPPRTLPTATQERRRACPAAASSAPPQRRHRRRAVSRRSRLPRRLLTTALRRLQ